MRMKTDKIKKTTRLYIDLDLVEGQSIALPGHCVHYLRNVMRASQGDHIRLFNGRDGQVLAEIQSISKKEIIVQITEIMRPQPPKTRSVHLYFAPIKKTRMDFLIEKAVELGASDLHPILTQNTEIRKINEERVTAQITEAAEQCERLDLPKLHDLRPLKTIIHEPFPLYACLERIDSQNPPIPSESDIGFIIGPEGGFTSEEFALLNECENITPVSLSPHILRAETAAIAALCLPLHGNLI